MPLAIDTQKIKAASAATSPAKPGATPTAASSSPADLYSLALLAGLNGQNLDPNGQAKKENFFNSDLAKLGYLPNQVVAPRSYYELKRGSVIPATLITGINSDLPGRITAQVSQNVYDSATGYRLLIPQGTKLMGRYDSKISFGQSRVLVIWTDIIFPNGSTLQIGGMAGTDAEGYGGFTDQVDNHYFKTFGSAILLAIIGTGMDMAVPQSSTLATKPTRVGRRTTEFCGNLRPCCGAHHQQEPRCAADAGDLPRLSVQRPCRSGHCVPWRLSGLITRNATEAAIDRDARSTSFMQSGL